MKDAALPLVEPLERALYLRSIEMFERLAPHEIAVLARYMRERYITRGSVVFEQDVEPSEVLMLVDGRIRIERDGKVVGRRTAPYNVGLVGLLAGQGSARTVAETDLVALVIEASAFLDVIEDHFGVFLRIRSTLARQLIELQVDLGIFSHFKAVPSIDAYPQSPLGMVERLVWLRRSPVFEGLGLNVLAALLRDDMEGRFSAGDRIWKVGDEATALHLIVHGMVEGIPEARRGRFRAGPGIAIGVDSAYGGVPYAYDAVAETPVVTIRLDSDVMLDVMEDHPHLAWSSMRLHAREVLRLQDLRAQIDDG